MNSDFRRIPRNETARVRLALEGSFSMWEVTHSCITCSFLFSLLKCVRVPFDRIACNTPLCSRARNGKTQTDFKIRSRHQLSPKQQYLWPYRDQYPANFFFKIYAKDNWISSENSFRIDAPTNGIIFSILFQNVHKRLLWVFIKIPFVYFDKKCVNNYTEFEPGLLSNCSNHYSMLADPREGC